MCVYICMYIYTRVCVCVCDTQNLYRGPACMLSHFSHVQLFAIPWTVAHQAPLSLGFFRQEYWSGLPFPPPADLCGPGIEPNPSLGLLLHWQVCSLLLAPPAQPLMSTSLGNTVDTERIKRERRVREKRCSGCDFFQNGFNSVSLPICSSMLVPLVDGVCVLL